MALEIVVTNADGTTTTHTNADGFFISVPDSAQRVQVLFNGVLIDLNDLTLVFPTPNDPNAPPSVQVTLPPPNSDQEVTLTGNVEALLAPAAGTPDPDNGTGSESNLSTFNEASVTDQMEFGSGGGGSGPDGTPTGDGPGDPQDIFLPGEDAAATATNGPPVAVDDFFSDAGTTSETAIEAGVSVVGDLTPGTAGQDFDPDGDPFAVNSVGNLQTFFAGTAVVVTGVVAGTPAAGEVGRFIITTTTGTALLTIGADGTTSLGATAGDPFRGLEANETGTITVDYTIQDPSLATSNLATATIEIIGVNDPPVANPDSNCITELMVSDDATANNVTGNVLANDTDPENDGLTVTAISDRAGAGAVGGATAGTFGTLTLAANGGYTYELNDANGTVDGLDDGETLIDTFTYIADDGAGGSDTATLNITIKGANDAPVANPDVNSITELMVSDDATPNNVTGNVLANDTDVDIEPLAVGAISDGVGPGVVGGATAGAFGTLTIAAGGGYTYELNDANPTVDGLDDGETLIDVFTYTVTDGDKSDTATLTITINGANDAPVANPDTNSITEAGANGEPMMGTLAVLTENPCAAENPCEAATPCNPCVVMAPTNFVTGDVLTNDSDPDNLDGTVTDTLTVSAISGQGAPEGESSDGVPGSPGMMGVPAPGEFGSLLIAADGGYTYELDDTNTDVDALGEGETLIDSFIYTVTDGDKTDTASLSITINGALDDCPVARSDSVSITELMVSNDDTPNNVIGEPLPDNTGPPEFQPIPERIPDADSVLANDSASINGPITVSAISGGGSPGTPGGTMAVASDGAFGSLTIASNGNYTYELDDSNTDVDALDDGESLIDVFTYTIFDGVKFDSATLTITINGANDAPVAVDDVNSIAELGTNGERNGPVDIKLALLENPCVSENPCESVTPSNVVTGDVTPGSADVTTNDYDPDNLDGTITDTLTVTAISNGGNPRDGTPATGMFGSLTIDTDGNYTYELDNSNTAVDGLDDDETLIDVFTYSVTDGEKADSATLTITINGANDAPVAVDDVNSITELGTNGEPNGLDTFDLALLENPCVSENPCESVTPSNVVTGDVTPGSADVTTNDYDPDNLDGTISDTLTVSTISFGTVNGTVSGDTFGDYGTLTIAPDGSYTYTLDDADPTADALNDGQSLTDTFTYTVTDGEATDTATLTITIDGTTDTVAPPAAAPAAAPCAPCAPCVAATPCAPCAPGNPCAAENPCALENPCNPCAAAAVEDPIQIEDVLSPTDNSIDFGGTGGTGDPPDPTSPTDEPETQETEVVGPPAEVTILDTGAGPPGGGGAGTEEVLINA